MDEDAGRTSSAASRQSVLGITPTHRETLVITIGRPVVDGRSQPSLVTTHAVRLVLTQRVAECPDDWTLDRITCFEEAIYRICLKPHVGVSPEQPLADAILEERLN